MQMCTQCHRATADESPYCTSCGHERIAESLVAHQEPPGWYDQAAKAAAIAVGVWLLVTVGVAFLREAKALRWARAALEANEAEKAYGLVSPFLAAHPDDAEALFLAGSSALRSRRPRRAIEHYSALVRLEDKDAVERAQRLEAVYNDEIPRLAAVLSCGQRPFAEFFESFEVLGTAFDDALLHSAASVAKKCVLEGTDRIANEPGFWLIHDKQLDAERVVTTVYVEPIGAAIEQGSYVLARSLAEQGTSLWPQAAPRVDALLNETRARVGATLEVIRDTLALVSEDAAFRVGRSRCFPISPPDAVKAKRDAWGNPLTYAPGSLAWNSQCYQAFEVTSLGADGKATPDDRGFTPDMDLTCAYTRSGREQCNLRDRFWLPAKS